MLNHLNSDCSLLLFIMRLPSQFVRRKVPGGYLMLATQTKPALMRNNIPAPAPGQLRRWVDRHELQELLAPHFQVKKMFSITPCFTRGLLRIANSYRLQRAADRAFLGRVLRGVKRIESNLWLGWTIMVLAEVRR